jgi:transcriptional regulator with XRE-family HTH domain
MAAPMQLCYKQFALRVEQIRNALGWSQADLAKKIGLSRASVASLETGRQRVQLHQVEKIAEALGTSPKHLMRGIWT